MNVSHFLRVFLHIQEIRQLLHNLTLHWVGSALLLNQTLSGLASVPSDVRTGFHGRCDVVSGKVTPSLSTWLQ